MGNQHSAQPKVQMSDILAADVPNLVYKETLAGTGRFLKSITCRVDDASTKSTTMKSTRDGIALVKVHVKRPGAFPDLRAHERAIHETMEALTTPEPERPHCWPFTRVLETERAVYLMRQFCHMSLHERLSARPFLSDVQRAWIAYQLLHAVNDAHLRGVTHGDIKCENVCVTSWGWCFLCDFASFKPSQIPIDNPAEFTYFFDSDGKRRCCLAPERFSREKRSTAEAMMDETPTTNLDPSVDIYALGCTIAELYMDGKALFDLSEALAYWKGEHNPLETLLSGVKDDRVRGVISSMIAIEPNRRQSAAAYLEKCHESGLFPPYFERMHAFSAKFLDSDANGRLAMMENQLDELLEEIVGYEGDSSGASHGNIRRIDDGLGKKHARVQCPGIVLVASHICSSLRGATDVNSRMCALKLLRHVKRFATDQTILQVILPYCVTALQDPVAFVRAEALRAIADILTAVQEIPQSDFGLFPEYIWPAVSNAATDSERLVRVAVASVIAQLARSSVEFLQYAVAMEANGGDPVSFDSEIALIRNTVQSVMFALLGSKSSEDDEAVWIALLISSAHLASFFGRDETNDFLIPLMITCLNSPSPQLRVAFFEHISGVANVVGRSSSESVFVPCIERCLIDVHDSVISAAMRCMTALIAPSADPKQSAASPVGKHATLKIAKSASPLLCHPSAMIRSATQAFFASASKSLGAVDTFMSLVPIVKPYLDKSDPSRCKLLSLTPEFLSNPDVLAMCLYPPPTRAAFESAVSQATGARKAAVYAAVSARMDRPVDREASRVDESVVINNEVDFPSITAMSAYIKSVANTRQMRSAESNESQRFNVNPPSIVEDLDYEDAGVNDAWVSIFGTKTPVISLHDAQPISLNEDAEDDALIVNAVESSVVDTLSAAVRRFDIGTNRFMSNGPPEAETLSKPSHDDWTPRGVLAAHLLEHRGTVTSIAVDREEAFFVTGSEDGSCKIWDTRRLEHDVSFQSRLTYESQGGKITSVVSTSDSHIVSGSDNGTVHAWRVEYTTSESTKTPGGKRVPKQYKNATDVRHVNKSEGAVNAVTALGEHVACYITQRAVYGWDYRAPRDAFRLTLNAKHGVASSLALDPSGIASWLIIGTASGTINLLDLRFQTCVQEWNHPCRGSGIDAMAVSTSSHGSSGTSSRPLVWCAAGHDEVALWDVADGGCRRILRVLRGQGAALDAAAKAPPGAMEANGRLRIVPRSQSTYINSSTLMSSAYGNFSQDLRADELLSTSSRSPGARALLALPNGSLISGSTDSCIRVWHPGDASKSRVLSGKISGPRPKYAEQSVSGVVIHQEYPTAVPDGARRSGVHGTAHERHDCHRDAVVSLATVSASSGKMLISGSRDMSVKVWK
jgi:phosphoinositide-3-kinase regulatory subunit 4